MSKLKINAPEAEVGVIVARFQTDDLTQGHKELIDFVLDNHQKVIIFLGLHPVIGTLENPLDFQARRQMVRESYPEKEYPSLEVAYIKDINNDEIWSRHLDGQIDSLAHNQTVVLYGSRDSFKPHYYGKHLVQELEATTNISATEIRRRIKATTRPSRDFRAGIIHNAANQYPKVHTTVDIAITNDDETELLLGKKENENKWCFVGGFADVNRHPFEHDAKREGLEETKLEISEPQYVCSMYIDDWRYRDSRDCIKTLFFKAKRVFGAVIASDDLPEAKWFKVSDLKPEMLVGSHDKLFVKLVENLKK